MGFLIVLHPHKNGCKSFYNHRLTQTPSRSEKSEAEYNQDLARAFLKKHNMPIVEPKPPYLSLPESAVKNQRVFLQEQFGLSADKNGCLCIAEQVVQQQVSHCRNMLN